MANATTLEPSPYVDMGAPARGQAGAKPAGRRRNGLSERQRLIQRLNQLKSERSSWDTHYAEIAEVMLPRRFRTNLADANRGTKKNSKILNGEAQLALRTLAAGLMAGITSPSRPWMRLSLADSDLLELDGVPEWLHECTTRMLAQLARTNFYNVTSDSTYNDLGAWGTSFTMALPDQKTILRFYPSPVGQYWLASSSRGVIDTAFREFTMTVAQMVGEFGYENCSARIRNLYDNDKLDSRFPVCHVVEPNQDVDTTKADHRGMAWKSYWFESSMAEDKRTEFLRTGGHKAFPGLAPRWHVDGEDTYGRSPGMDALPDARSLQKLELLLGQQINLATKPTMKGPAKMQNGPAPSNAPGGLTLVPETGTGGEKYEPSYTIDHQAIRETQAVIDKKERRVNRFFFTDFWLAMLQDERATPATAEEIRAKKEERMLQLGPVLERVQNEYLAPTVDLLWDEMKARGRLPPPPQALVDAIRSKGLASIIFDVEYVSIAAAAQKALGLTNVRSFLELVGMAGQLDPQATGRVDVDYLVTLASRLLGVDPKLLKNMEVVKQLRAASAKAQQAQEQGAAMMAATQGAKNLGTTPAPAQDNALGTMLQSLGPQAATLLPYSNAVSP